MGCRASGDAGGLNAPAACMVRIAEKFQKGKRSDALCEDVAVECEGYVAVIDGATPKGKLRWGGKTSGRMAAETIAGAVESLRPDARCGDFVDAATNAVMKVYASTGRTDVVRAVPCERLCAAAVVYSVARRQVWMVGDCQFMINGRLFTNPKYIDKCLAGIRADADSYLLANGHSVEDLRRRDIGREIIYDALCQQSFFENTLCGDGRFNYAVIDGFPLVSARNMPQSMKVMCVDVAQGSEVVLATDGYPELHATLAETEKTLGEMIEEDVLCVSLNRQTKGVMSGNNSYDDRTYIRFTT